MKTITLYTALRKFLESPQKACLVVGVDQFRVKVEAIDMAGRSVELSRKIIVEELSVYIMFL